ncbi:MAG: nuclear transport factor 2 family protein [Rubritalea sp.]|jgi:hypothetical protein|tara:strand:- start:722 stop:1120 length:399 start_codon:yes stop_codon:yes gene_type:complete
MKPITLETRPPLPPFTAEDAWNTCDPQKVSMAYTKDTEWRNRTEYINGRTEVRNFLERKWKKELNYRLRKTLWSYTDNRISVKFVYEYQDATGQWFRAYGNEQWEFSTNGLMQKREASINDMVIDKPSIGRH